MIEEIARASLGAWVKSNKIKNENGKEINLRNYYFLFDLYEDDSDEIVIKKSAQSGVSTYAILKGLHNCRYWGINGLHTLPTVSDASTFVQSKVNKIIENNPCLADKMSKTDTDSVGQKQMGDGFLFYKGTIGKTTALMFTSDQNIHDELDFSDAENIKTYSSRQEGEASLRKKIWISTPTIPEYGIDEKWEESDQKNLRFNCPHCGYRQHMEWVGKNNESNVDHDNDRYRCQDCDGTIDNTLFPHYFAGSYKGGPYENIDMRWEARYPDREMSGYWINQMIIPWKPAKQLLKEYRECKAGDAGGLTYFHNFKLGNAYQTVDNKITAELFLKNTSDKTVDETDSVMGVDVQQDELYTIIGSGQGIYGITRCKDQFDHRGKLIKSKWDELGDYMDVYGVKASVIDATYKPNDVLTFASRYPHRVFMNWYQNRERGGKVYRYGDDIKFTDKRKPTFSEEVKVLTDRERAIDKLVTHLDQKQLTFLYHPDDPEFQELIKHCKCMYARMVDTKEGKRKREWASTGKDDYFHALVYFEVALHKLSLIHI